MNQHRTQIIYHHLHPEQDSASVTEPSLAFSPTSANEQPRTENRTQSTISYEVQNGVAVLKFNSPPVNALSNQFVSALVRKFMNHNFYHVIENVNRAFEDHKVKAVVLSSMVPKIFIAGADISDMVVKQNSNDPGKMVITTY
jgi:enoyl-CoA hydratase/carnithine racemase